MNIASLMNPEKSRPAEPRRMQLVKVQATVLVQGALGAVKDGMKDGVEAFRSMRDLLTGHYAHGRL